MKKQLLSAVCSCAAVAALVASPVARAAHPGEGLQWGDAPPVLPKGSKLAVLQGDPTKPGPFVMRLSMPPGYKIAPHSHTKTENVTVISGTFLVGMGEKFDTKALKPMAASAFASVPGQMNHYAMTKVPTVIQIHGEGPFDMTYVNAKDDPQVAASK